MSRFRNNASGVIGEREKVNFALENQRENIVYSPVYPSFLRPSLYRERESYPSYALIQGNLAFSLYYYIQLWAWAVLALFCKTFFLLPSSCLCIRTYHFFLFLFILLLPRFADFGCGKNNSKWNDLYKTLWGDKLFFPPNNLISMSWFHVKILKLIQFAFI